VSCDEVVGLAREIRACSATVIGCGIRGMVDREIAAASTEYADTADDREFPQLHG
jgi:hypothetical protein